MTRTDAQPLQAHGGDVVLRLKEGGFGSGRTVARDERALMAQSRGMSLVEVVTGSVIAFVVLIWTNWAVLAVRLPCPDRAELRHHADLHRDLDDPQLSRATVL